jgi:dipeptidyl aminopeptidase/acylaminoacyl peptidase
MSRRQGMWIVLFALGTADLPWPARAGAEEILPERRWTVDDIIAAERIHDLDISRDGQLAAWIQSSVREVEGEEKRVHDLWLARLGTTEPEVIQLTHGRHDIDDLAISPGGGALAFTPRRRVPAGTPDSSEKSLPQLWVLSLAGGEARRVTAFDRTVEAFGWIDDETLVVARKESPGGWERERKESKDTSRVVEDAEREPPVRLFRVSVDGQSHRLTTNRDWIDSLSVSPDRRRAVVTAQQSLSYEFDHKVPPRAFLVDVESGRRTEILGETNLLVGEVSWETDGSAFYFLDDYTTHPVYRTATVTRLHCYDLATGSHERLDLGWPAGLEQERKTFATARGVFGLLADGVRFRPARIERSEGKSRRHELAGRHSRNLEDWAVSADGSRVLYKSSSVTTPPQLFAARLEGDRLVDERQLTRLNPTFADKPTGRAEIVRWPGALGEEVEGILRYPLNWQEGRRYPLILDIHGGPTSVDRDRWDNLYPGPNILWRQRGAFVLQVNYHGSSNYGLEWAESIRERYYELEIPDIRAGVDLLIERGLVDPERLASSGWSNGGILTAELITRDARFKAAVVGAADIEWFSDWANVDFGASFDNYYFGGPPWEEVETYLAKSPFFRLTQVSTPTLIHTGTKDRNVPPHQSWSLFRVLQQLGKTETRLLLYPGEPHGLRKIAHQRRKVEEDMAWFERYLFGTSDPEAEAERAVVPEVSLLRALLDRFRAARHAGRFGLLEDGTLVPETVTLGALEIGRFEVTRAQWAAFDAGAAASPDPANLPVTGISFQEARDYVRWLAERTGRAFRLPSVAEARALAERAGAGGNTLDRWAGYRVNPDDATALRGVLTRHGVTLLLPAGRLPGTRLSPEGEVAFDLDGNAAEWALGEDGSGIAIGPSAERPRDAHGRISADPAYTGLRVVVER